MSLLLLFVDDAVVDAVVAAAGRLALCVGWDGMGWDGMGWGIDTVDG